jgi:hypothetical protein
VLTGVVLIRGFFAPSIVANIMGIRGMTKVMLNKLHVPTCAQHLIESE